MVTGYCCDWADRLTATTVTLAPGAASPIVGTPLTTANLTYDTRGNTVKLADQSLTYDISDRHMGTAFTDGTTISYARDAIGRIDGPAHLGRRLESAIAAGAVPEFRVPGPRRRNGLGPRGRWDAEMALWARRFAGDPLSYPYSEYPLGR